MGAATFLETFAGVLDGKAIVEHCAQAHDPDRYIQLLGLGCRIWIAEVAPDASPVGYVVVGPRCCPSPGPASSTSSASMCSPSGTARAWARP
ncbi:MAG: hypothetical protein WDN45_13740 [Caulobacteraceae bacterium]